MEHFGALLLFCYTPRHRLEPSRQLAEERFFHFHGEPAVHLDRGTSVYDKNKVHKRSVPFHILNCLLFSSPCAYLREIESMLSDGLLSHVAWREFVDKLCKDWLHLTLYISSTVLINVDVAFLSIQSVDSRPSSSPLKIVTYLSVLSSLGSIFFALLLLRRNNTKSNISIDKAIHLCLSSSPRYEDIAIIFVLPYTVLMWGCVLFFESNRHFDGLPDWV
ncbi:hypothetical protein IW261DRAFT_1400628 [Armillaria novae-zelandiae]|uniref:Uncharacterized protein n=1 Tax=Armillaria novae-zelandiae TaxID=153914 RepID=A0AA39P583_9AGAR|nr:hypothetical protein IW261DRAFT_1400628 [Armillaria novae-zelandiae]